MALPNLSMQLRTASLPTSVAAQPLRKRAVPTALCATASKDGDLFTFSTTTHTAQELLLRRLSHGLVAGAATFALAAGFPSPSAAIGPQSIPLDVTSYSLIDCPPGISKDTKCISVTANVENRAGKSAYNSEVFGRVRYKRTGESALYGDFAEATDAGKLTDIPDEIKPGQSKVTFLVKLDKAYNEDEALDFVSLKARTYPGMRQEFRIMKPVSATESCPEAELGEECEEIPF